MPKLAIVIGTRPEAIKLLPVYSAFKINHPEVQVDLISTGQHKEMLTQVFDLFEVQPNFSLEIMHPNQTIGSLLSRLIADLETLFALEKYEGIFVQGDTTTAFAAALTAFNQKIKVFHVEAGLRSHDLQHPFPEEANRKLISVLTNLNFTPTKKATEQLLSEGYKSETIFEVGNTVIDALLEVKKAVDSEAIRYTERFKDVYAANKKFILVTSHRRENFGEGLKNICEAIIEVAKKRPEIEFIYPVHLNPNVQEVVKRLMSGIGNIKLIHPVAYDEMVFLMDKSYFILTDSGGIQEEAPSLNKAVLVMRETTERQEGIDAGCALLVGTDKQNIIHHLTELIENDQVRLAMEACLNPYGDGNTSKKIATQTLNYLKN